MEAFQQRTRIALSKSYLDLPLAKDLPRLAKCMTIIRADGNILHSIETLRRSDHVCSHVEDILTTLTKLFYGSERAVSLQDAFRQKMNPDNISFADILNSFIREEMGGDDNKVVKVLKACNQAAISSGVIEIKTKLGANFVTKDSPNGWRFILHSKFDSFVVLNRKVERDIHDEFEFEWEMRVEFERNIAFCQSVDLTVIDFVHTRSAEDARDTRLRDLSLLLEPYFSPDLDEIFRNTSSRGVASTCVANTLISTRPLTLPSDISCPDPVLTGRFTSSHSTQDLVSLVISSRSGPSKSARKGEGSGTPDMKRSKSPNRFASFSRGAASPFMPTKRSNTLSVTDRSNSDIPNLLMSGSVAVPPSASSDDPLSPSSSASHSSSLSSSSSSSSIAKVSPVQQADPIKHPLSLEEQEGVEETSSDTESDSSERTPTRPSKASPFPSKLNGSTELSLSSSQSSVPPASLPPNADIVTSSTATIFSSFSGFSATLVHPSSSVLPGKYTLQVESRLKTESISSSVAHTTLNLSSVRNHIQESVRLPASAHPITKLEGPLNPLRSGEKLLWESGSSSVHRVLRASSSSGEGGTLVQVLGRLFLTSYKLYFLPNDRHPKITQHKCGTLIPVTFVTQFKQPRGRKEKKDAKEKDLIVEIHCRDLRIVRFLFADQKSLLSFCSEFPLSLPTHPRRLSAFRFQCDVAHNENGWRFHPFAQEVSRMGVTSSNTWRVSNANLDYSLSPSYPRFLCVPSEVDDATLRRAASFRKDGHIPVLTWRHPDSGVCIFRCSEPKEKLGPQESRCGEDEKLFAEHIYARSRSTIGSRTSFYVIHVGTPSAAFLSRTKGSYGEVVDDVRVGFLNLPPLGSFREVYRKMGSQIMKESLWVPDDPSVTSDEISIGWMRVVQQFLCASVEVVKFLACDNSSVCLVSQFGKDRIFVVSSLAQLLIDPFYRTIFGFQALIEKEWLGFGYPFLSRGSLLWNCDDSLEGPTFVLFIECVYQICVQFPSAFEFNPFYLFQILYHSTSGLFGTFLCDTDQEREESLIRLLTSSLWSITNSTLPEITNPFYDKATYHGPIVPVTAVQNLRFWREYYFQHSQSFFPTVDPIMEWGKHHILLDDEFDNIEIVMNEEEDVVVTPTVTTRDRSDSRVSFMSTSDQDGRLKDLEDENRLLKEKLRSLHPSGESADDVDDGGGLAIKIDLTSLGRKRRSESNILAPIHFRKEKGEEGEGEREKEKEGDSPPVVRRRAFTRSASKGLLRMSKIVVPITPRESHTPKKKT